jgi:hypothetical protein
LPAIAGALGTSSLAWPHGASYQPEAKGLRSPPSGSQLPGLPVNTDSCSSTETDAIQLLDAAPQEGGLLHSGAPVAEGSVPLLSEQFDECSPLVTDAEVGNQASWEAFGNRPFAAPEDDVVAHVDESTPAVTVRQRPEKCRPGAALYWPLLLQLLSGILGPSAGTPLRRAGCATPLPPGLRPIVASPSPPPPRRLERLP